MGSIREKILNGKDLKNARNCYHVSVDSLASVTGLSRSLIQKLESNVRTGTTQTWEKINDFFQNLDSENLLHNRLLSDAQKYGDAQEISLDVKINRQEYMTFKVIDYDICETYTSPQNHLITTIGNLKDILDIGEPTIVDDFDLLAVPDSVLTCKDLTELNEIIDIGLFAKLHFSKLPSDDEVLKALLHQSFIEEYPAGFRPTFLGLICFAKSFGDFPEIEENIICVNTFGSNTITQNFKQEVFTCGLIKSIPDAAEYLSIYCNVTKQLNEKKIPSEDTLDSPYRIAMEKALTQLIMNIYRAKMLNYNEPLAINAYPDRIEFSFPGCTNHKLLKNVNSKLTSVFTNYLSIGNQVEHFISQADANIPSPQIIIDNQNVILTLYTSKTRWSKEERILTCYRLSCECLANNELMSAKSVLDRLNIKKENRAIASRTIKDTLDAGLIKISNPDQPANARTFIPFWYTL